MKNHELRTFLLHCDLGTTGVVLEERSYLGAILSSSEGYEAVLNIFSEVSLKLLRMIQIISWNARYPNRNTIELVNVMKS